ncbi:hypothetical protein D3C71_1277340 [compost metagenome]
MQYGVSLPTTDDNTVVAGFEKGSLVTRHTFANSMDFPCIILKCENPKGYSITALQGIMGYKSLLQNDDMYYIYLDMGSGPSQIGVLPKTNLKALIGNRTFRFFDKCVYLNESESYTGDMLYALCQTSAV